MTDASALPPSLPAEVAVELQRVAERWRQLPLGHALVRLPAVQAVVEELAGQPVPDLGPAVVIDQLRVMAYDAAVGGMPTAELAERLASLRRSLA